MCLTTAGYKGSLWCQPENGLLRQSGFYGVMLHFLNHTIKAPVCGEKEIDCLVFIVQKERHGEKEEWLLLRGVIYVVAPRKRGVLDR